MFVIFISHKPVGQDANVRRIIGDAVINIIVVAWVSTSCCWFVQFLLSSTVISLIFWTS